MAVNKKSALTGLIVFCLIFAVSLPAAALVINAAEIYWRAKTDDRDFLQRLSTRYPKAMDMEDRSGKTAYCLALSKGDVLAQQRLALYGADTNHSCVKVVQEEKTSAIKRAKQTAARRATREAVQESGNNYLWWGLGALAVGGGIAAVAASGGGGGGGSSSYDDTYGTKYLGTGTPSGTLYDVSADEFKTTEYLNSNFLSGINAAEAYSYMYKKGEDGLLYSHQANSDDALKKVKVGILDTGVYGNRDLGNKVVSSYDINDYNNEGNILAKFVDDVQYYIYRQGDKYWFVKLDEATNTLNLYAYDDDNNALSAEELGVFLNYFGLSLSDFSVMNGNGTSGTSYTALFTDSNDYLYSLWWADVIGDLNHGTHVAGIVAADKNDMGGHGVAFENAQIVSASWDLKKNIYDTVKGMVDEGVSVINNSWGANASDDLNATHAEEIITGDSDTFNAYLYAAKNGAVWVQATGNEGYEDAGLYTGMGNLDLSSYGYTAGKYEAPFLAVASLDPDTADSSAPSGKLADYSNWCGSTKGYCLAAPGTDVLSTGTVKEGFLHESGTSMATPVVTGSVALLMGYYPWLSAQNVAYLLLETSNDEGEYADSDKYGQGALDLEAAVTTPIGNLGLPTGTSVASVTPAALSRLSLSTSVQNKMLKALPEKITAFDELNRPFDFDTKNLVNTTHASNASLRNSVARAAMAGTKKTVKDDKTGFAFSSSESLNNGGKANLANAEVVSESSAGSTRFYYAENSKYDTTESVLTPSANPYLAMNEAYGAENSFNLSDVSKLKLSLQTGENGLYERDYEQDKHSFRERSYAVSGEYSFNMADYLELAVLGGMLSEKEALLGMNGTGAFGIGDTATYYTGLKAALKLTPNLSLVAAYYRGYTQGADTAMLAISDLQTESFMLAGEYNLNATDKVGISFSSPLSVVKGRASLLYATGRDNYSDTVYMNKLTTSLTPEAKEYDLGMYYQGQPAEDLSLTGKVQARFNADGEEGVTDYIGIVGMQHSF